MENNSKSRVTYLEGGAPGALTAFIGVEAIFGIVMCVLSVLGTLVSLFNSGGTNILSTLISVSLSIYTSYLSYVQYKGLKNLRRGDFSGAADVESVCRKRRILIWIALGLYLLLMIILSFGARGGFLAILIAAALLVGCGLLVTSYYKGIEKVMSEVSNEVYSGSPLVITKVRRIAVYCIIGAVLAAGSAFLMSSNILALPSSLYSISSSLPTLLYLGAARCLLINLCYRGYLRAHEPLTEQRTDFAPSGNSDAPALSVLGSIVFGIFALDRLAWIVYILSNRYTHASALSILFQVALFAGYALLAYFLMRRGRILFALIGASVIVVRDVAVIINNLQYQWALATNISLVLTIVFMLVFIAAAVMQQQGRANFGAFRVILIVLAAAVAVVPLVAAVINGDSILSILNRILDEGLYCIALLGLVWMLREPAVSDSGEPEPAKENAVLPADGAAQN